MFMNVIEFNLWFAFQAFEWIVRDVERLKEYVEGVNEGDCDEFEILKESPMLGDGKFKLEIGDVL